MSEQPLYHIDAGWTADPFPEPWQRGQLDQIKEAIAAEQPTRWERTCRRIGDGVYEGIFNLVLPAVSVARNALWAILDAWGSVQ